MFSFLCCIRFQGIVSRNFKRISSIQRLLLETMVMNDIRLLRYCYKSFSECSIFIKATYSDQFICKWFLFSNNPIMAALPKTLDPNPYNKIWNVNFHQRNMFQYNEVLGNYGRFKMTIRHLKIREGCHLLKTGKKDIRGLLFEEYEEFLPRREGSLVEWVVISEAHDIDLVFSTNLRVGKIYVLQFICIWQGKSRNVPKRCIS